MHWEREEQQPSIDAASDSFCIDRADTGFPLACSHRLRLGRTWDQFQSGKNFTCEQEMTLQHASEMCVAAAGEDGGKESL